jgi:hypothetical protein
MKNPFEILEQAKDVTEDEIDKILEDFKNKPHYKTKYEIWNLRERLIIPYDFKEIFNNLQRCLSSFNVQLTEEQLNKIENCIQEYKEKFDLFQKRYINIKEERQKKCSHDDISEYMYAQYVCNQCGKEF